MKKLLLVLALFVAISGYSQHELVKLWETDTLLKVPESVLFDGTNNVLYVSNIDGTDPWSKDGKGSIGKVSLDGKIIAAEWVKGLHSPKGMAMYNGLLYVADLDNIVAIDIATGTIAQTILVSEAQGLNDVSIDRNGIIYVSDSKAKKVFIIERGIARQMLGDLKGPNGVLSFGSDLYLLDAGTLYRIGSDRSLNKIAEGFEGGSDGIENVTGNDFLISSWSGIMWYVHGNGTKHVLLDTRAEKKNSADIGYDPIKRIVYVPTFWKNSVVAYQVK